MLTFVLHSTSTNAKECMNVIKEIVRHFGSPPKGARLYIGCRTIGEFELFTNDVLLCLEDEASKEATNYVSYVLSHYPDAI